MEVVFCFVTTYFIGCREPIIIASVPPLDLMQLKHIYMPHAFGMQCIALRIICKSAVCVCPRARALLHPAQSLSAT